MSLGLRILARVNARSGTVVCVHCIAGELGVSAKSVYEAIRRLTYPPRAQVSGLLKAQESVLTAF